MIDVTVAIAHIPPRAAELQTALASVHAQTYAASAVVIESDRDHTGAGPTKNRALAQVRTEWVAFLDDDDYLFPSHLHVLVTEQLMTDADVIYSWPQMDGAPDPAPEMFGKPFDPDELRCRSYLHTTLLVRSGLAKAVGGFQKPPGSDYDDWGFHLALLDAGAVFVHVPERTWVWTVKGGNTSGRGDRW